MLFKYLFWLPLKIFYTFLDTHTHTQTWSHLASMWWKRLCQRWLTSSSEPRTWVCLASSLASISCSPSCFRWLLFSLNKLISSMQSCVNMKPIWCTLNLKWWFNPRLIAGVKALTPNYQEAWYEALINCMFYAVRHHFSWFKYVSKLQKANLRWTSKYQDLHHFIIPFILTCHIPVSPEQ